jgi:PncC family amidohydrolase
MHGFKMKKLPQKIIKLLSKKKLKISFAESCTGGLLSCAITSVSGSSKIFSLGLVTYSNQSKNSILKIPKKILRKYGAVSYESCLSMVKNLSKISKTGVSVSITGIAGPKGGSKKKPVGLVYIGIKKGNKILVKKHLFKNKGRLYIQKTSVNKSLGIILSFIK